MRRLLYTSLIFIVTLLFSCTQKESNVPKPRAYPRIDRTDSLLLHSMDHFEFRYPSDATLKMMPADKENQVWFNMEYPNLNAVLYCSYTKIIPAELGAFMTDNKKFIHSNAQSNVRVEESDYSKPENGEQGAIYYFDGNAISPYQFYLTDSTSYFLRGSLYYGNVVHTDSILATSRSLKKDIMNLMESFENKLTK